MTIKQFDSHYKKALLCIIESMCKNDNDFFAQNNLLSDEDKHFLELIYNLVFRDLDIEKTGLHHLKRILSDTITSLRLKVELESMQTDVPVNKLNSKQASIYKYHNELFNEPYNVSRRLKYLCKLNFETGNCLNLRDIVFCKLKGLYDIEATTTLPSTINTLICLFVFSSIFSGFRSNAKLYSKYYIIFYISMFLIALICTLINYFKTLKFYNLPTGRAFKIEFSDDLIVLTTISIILIFAVFLRHTLFVN